MKGYIALSSVLVISVVIISIVTTVIHLSIGELQSGLSLHLGERNLNVTESCVEDVLLRVHANSTIPNSPVSLPEGSCNITVNGGLSGPTNYDLTISSLDTNYSRKIRVVFTRGSTISLTSWQEI